MNFRVLRVIGPIAFGFGSFMTGGTVVPAGLFVMAGLFAVANAISSKPQ
jgi:hypothetical protein